MWRWAEFFATCEPPAGVNHSRQTIDIPGRLLKIPITLASVAIQANEVYQS